MSRLVTVILVITIVVVAYMVKNRNEADKHELTPSQQQICERLTHYIDPGSECPL